VRNLRRVCVASVVVVLCGLGARGVSAAEAKNAADGEVRQFLADHQTLAVFDGLQYRLCRGLTALCPKECGDSGEFANFSIRKYVKYQKLGQYGDEKQTSFPVQVSDYNKKPKGDAEINKTVAGLKKGDYVLLSWRHDYVTKDGVSSPERPIVKLEKIDKAKAEELLKQK
jgi:hypothetical protein